MTKEDLEQIGELFVAEREHTKKLLEANNRIFGTIFKVELSSTKQEIVAAAKAGFQETAKQIHRVEQKLDRVAEDHKARITRLEEAADLAHKN